MIGRTRGNSPGWLACGARPARIGSPTYEAAARGGRGYCVTLPVRRHAVFSLADQSGEREDQVRTQRTPQPSDSGATRFAPPAPAPWKGSGIKTVSGRRPANLGQVPSELRSRSCEPVLGRSRVGLAGGTHYRGQESNDPIFRVHPGGPVSPSAARLLGPVRRGSPGRQGRHPIPAARPRRVRAVPGIPRVSTRRPGSSRGAGPASVRDAAGQRGGLESPV